MFAQRCFGGREGTATVRRVPAPRSLSLTIGQRSQSVIRMMCLRSISAQIACFVAFCDMRGGSVCVLRDRPNTLEACHCYRVVFSWQAQHANLVHCPISWQAQHFVTWSRCCFDKLQYQGCANMTQCQKSWQGQHCVSCLKLRKNHIFLSCVKTAINFRADAPPGRAGDTKVVSVAVAGFRVVALCCVCRWCCRWCCCWCCCCCCCCLLLVACCGCWLLVVGCCWLVVVGWLLLIGCWLLFVVCCLLFVVRCLLFAACCSLLVVCCLLFVACCLCRARQKKANFGLILARPRARQRLCNEIVCSLCFHEAAKTLGFPVILKVQWPYTGRKKMCSNKTPKLHLFQTFLDSNFNKTLLFTMFFFSRSSAKGCYLQCFLAVRQNIRFNQYSQNIVFFQWF